MMQFWQSHAVVNLSWRMSAEAFYIKVRQTALVA